MTKSEFISEVEKRFQQKMEKAFNFKYAKSVFVIRGIENKNEYYFYIKESKIDKPFWGFTDVIIDGLEETNCPYFLILLSAENNYCFSNDLVLNFCKNLSYSETGEEKGEFKLTPSYLVNYDHCKLNLDNLLEQARNTSEVINKKEI